MLRDGGCAAALPICAVVLPQRADDAPHVKARVGIKILVFGGNCRGDQRRGNIVERDKGAASGVRVNDLVQRIPITVEDARCFKL